MYPSIDWYEYNPDAWIPCKGAKIVTDDGLHLYENPLSKRVVVYTAKMPQLRHLNPSSGEIELAYGTVEDEDSYLLLCARRELNNRIYYFNQGRKFQQEEIQKMLGLYNGNT